jgi:4-hydroxy-3-methylbut-2-enyl diphosphate reductase IspH
MDILLANPRGFCAGVERAIAIVERALEKFGAPIYVRHEVVHNRSSSTACAPRARSSSRNSTRCPTAPR